MVPIEVTANVALCKSKGLAPAKAHLLKFKLAKGQKLNMYAGNYVLAAWLLSSRAFLIGIELLSSLIREVAVAQLRCESFPSGAERMAATALSGL